MKKIQTLLLSAFCVMLLLTSCEKENDPILYQTYGIAYPVEGEEYNFKVKTDLGNTLIPSNDNYKLDSAIRIYATFSFVNSADVEKDSAEVKFNFIDNILYKKIVDEDIDLGNSPVYVREGTIWQSEFYNIINIPFEFEGGGEKHIVNLFYNEDASNADTISLEFKHNDNADFYNQRISAIVSFDLTSIEDYTEVADSIVYKLSFNRGGTASFLEEWTGVYKID